MSKIKINQDTTKQCHLGRPLRGRTEGTLREFVEEQICFTYLTDHDAEYGVQALAGIMAEIISTLVDSKVISAEKGLQIARIRTNLAEIIESP